MVRGSKKELKKALDKIPNVTAEIFNECTMISYKGMQVLRIWDINLIHKGTLKPSGRTNKLKAYVQVPFEVRLPIVDAVSDYWTIADSIEGEE